MNMPLVIWLADLPAWAGVPIGLGLLAILWIALWRLGRQR